MKQEAAATAWSIYESAAGFGLVAASTQGLLAHHLPYGLRTRADALEAASMSHPLAQEGSDLTRAAAALLERYFRGERVDFGLPLDLTGFTPFQQEVYRVVAAIPYATVQSYGEVAGACGTPKGARAIGGAMARNRLPIIIPCHRVVGASGVMTGFTAPGGIDSKRDLLMMEGVNVAAGGGVIR
ncbi:methylated-DNA--[protein]-cysteine S-methyltransferase [Geomonas oryzae]|uniref:methylated-DNA--[protein]-cysteine S-methyltransferase n=1 Tax=Geomonas oryzae TaxID=2364273 RepID=UPI00100AC7DF|nr:methylated-DNA--[protein]-cysteine S-methyltransferase [Geomonas oryzae]